MAVSRADGGVSVVYPIREREADESEEAYLASVMSGAVIGNPELAGRPWVALDDAELPPRADRERWRLVDGRVVVAAEEGA